jgi:hypothetical protein
VTSADQRLFDVQSAAKYLQSIGAAGVTPWTIRGLLSSGAVPCVKLGRRFYVSRVALDAWLRKHERIMRYAVFDSFGEQFGNNFEGKSIAKPSNTKAEEDFTRGVP